jgi:YHS domain-containing protein
MSNHFKVLSIVRREISRIWYPAIQLTTAVVFSLFLMPVLPIQAQQLATPNPTASTNRTDTTEPATDVAHVNESFVTTASYPEQYQQQTRPQVSSTTVRAQPTKTSLGLDGYCCVSLANQDGTAAAWMKGKPHIGIKHRGRIYLFSNQQNLQLFVSNPDKFSPVLSGFDPVLFTDHRRLIDGQRKYGVAYKKRLYLFQNEYTLRVFWNSPDRYAQSALDAMNRAR